MDGLLVLVLVAGYILLSVVTVVYTTRLHYGQQIELKALQTKVAALEAQLRKKKTAGMKKVSTRQYSGRGW